MKGLVVSARLCWGVPLCIPAALGQFWGRPWWVTVIGVSCLAASALFAAAAAYYRGSIDGMNWAKELYRG